MKILLVFPPFSLTERYNKSVGNVGGFLPPLGLLAMAAVLEKDKHEVQIMDCPVNSFILSDIMAKVDEFKPDLVGVAAVTSIYDKTMAICKAIREKTPDTLILVGGPHVKLDPQKVLGETGANVVLVGDADISITDIANNKEKYMVPQVVQGESVTDLDTLPYPARHLVDMNLYTSLPNNWKRSPHNFQVLSTRGCHFRCTFCASANGNYRRRSVPHVIGELKELKEKYDIKEVAFWDDIFTMNKQWVMEFCKAMKEEDLDLVWSCETRVHLMDPEMLKAMKEAGCWNVFLGIEAGDQDLLNNIKKGTTIELIRRGVKWIKAEGIEIRGSFMLGLPGETPEKALKANLIVQSSLQMNSIVIILNLVCALHFLEQNYMTHSIDGGNLSIDQTKTRRRGSQCFFLKDIRIQMNCGRCTKEHIEVFTFDQHTFGADSKN